MRMAPFRCSVMVAVKGRYGVPITLLRNLVAVKGRYGVPITLLRNLVAVKGRYGVPITLLRNLVAVKGRYGVPITPNNPQMAKLGISRAFKISLTSNFNS